MHAENQGKLFNHHPQKVVAVAYKRWSFKTGSNSKALTGKTLTFLIGGHILYGGSTVIHFWNWPLRANEIFLKNALTGVTLHVGNQHNKTKSAVQHTVRQRLTPFLSLQVGSTTETSGTGTRNAIPVSFPFSSGITFPTALAAPVDTEITF